MGTSDIAPSPSSDIAMPHPGDPRVAADAEDRMMAAVLLSRRERTGMSSHLHWLPEDVLDVVLSFLLRDGLNCRALPDILSFYSAPPPDRSPDWQANLPLASRAALAGDLQALKRLASVCDGRALRQPCPETGVTAVFCAAFNGELECVHYLLSIGCSPHLNGIHDGQRQLA